MLGHSRMAQADYYFGQCRLCVPKADIRGFGLEWLIRVELGHLRGVVRTLRMAPFGYERS